MSPLKIGLDCGARGVTLSHLAEGLQTNHFGWEEAPSANRQQDVPLSDQEMQLRLKHLLINQVKQPDGMGQQETIDCLTIARTSVVKQVMAHLTSEEFKTWLGSTVAEVQFVTDYIAIAAAWIGHHQQEQPVAQSQTDQNQTLLICDLGNTATRIYFCEVTPAHRVKLLYSDSQDSCGFAFDRACVNLSYQQKHGHNPDPLVQSKLLKSFEQEKLRTHDQTTLRLKQYLQHPEAMAEYALYAFGGGYLVKCHQVKQGFISIQSTFQTLVSALQEWLQLQQRSIDHLVLTGGFSQFWLARSSLLKMLDMNEEDIRFDHDFSNQAGEWAIAQGACLIANQQVDPFDRCPYTIGIVGETLNAALEKEQKLVPVFGKGVPMEALELTQYASTLLASFSENPVLVVGIDTPRQLKTYTINISDPLIHASPATLWRLGMQFSTSEMLSVVIEQPESQRQIKRELGKLSDIVNGDNLYGG
jgi:molecular chaperone DnaK